MKLLPWPTPLLFSLKRVLDFFYLLRCVYEALFMKNIF